MTFDEWRNAHEDNMRGTESYGRAAFIAGMRAAAEIVDNTDTVEIGRGHMRTDDARGTLVAARDAILRAAKEEEGT